tara:strand:- start:28 stop:495 length:468 start_codon:yes stop_codon:yes gene_type:complete
MQLIGLNKMDKNDIRKKMIDFKDALKLSSLQIPSEVESLLSMGRDYMKGANKEQLSIDAIRLAQYGLYIKSEINRLKSNISWCNANINSIIGRELPNTNGYGLAEKSLIIKRNDPVAKELESTKSLCETQLSSIEDVDRKIDFLSSCVKNLAFGK